MTPEEQDTPKKRIKILRDGIASLPDDYEGFDMETYVDGFSAESAEYEYSGIPPKNKKFECGTTMCAAGHAVLFGIKPLPEHFHKYGALNWDAFSEWLCGCQQSDYIWTFLFSGIWPSDPKQFVARADLFLTDSIPDNWNFDDRF